MTDERVRAAYDKIKIDPNSAVQIWKNILFMQSAIDTMMRKRAEATAAEQEEEPQAEAAPVQAEAPRAEEPRHPEILMHEQTAPKDDEEREVLWPPAVEASAPQETDDEDDVRIYTGGGEEPNADEDDVVIWKARETEADEEPEDYAQDGYAPADDEERGYDAQNEDAYAEETEDEYGEESEEPVRRRARHVKEKRKGPGKLIAIIAAAAVLIAAVVGVLLWRRGGIAPKKDDEGLTGSSDISIAVVTPKPIAFEGEKKSVEKLSSVQGAMDEWNSYKQTAKAEYIAEKLPSFAEFLQNDEFFDGTDVVENGDETYSCIHWQYVEDWGNTSISPVTGQEEPTLIQKFDYEHSVTVEKAEYEAYEAYLNAQLNAASYGDYNSSYGVENESDAAKLEEIAAKYGLTLRRGEGTSQGFGEKSSEELASALNTAAGGSVYSVTPEIDYFTTYDSGAFQAMAEIRLEDGRRMYTMLCCAPYTEMLDAMSAGGIELQDGGEMKTRELTAADGTELTIAQNEKQAIVYAYLEGSYVLVDMSINTWREAPGMEDTDEERAAKQETKLSLDDEAVNFAANCINYSNLG